MTDTAPPRHRWRRLPLRLNLRTLLVVVMVVGGVLGWVARRAHLQRAAVEAIRAAGGQVAYAWAWDDSLVTVQSQAGVNSCEGFAPTSALSAVACILSADEPSDYQHRV